MHVLVFYVYLGIKRYTRKLYLKAIWNNIGSQLFTYIEKPKTMYNNALTNEERIYIKIDYNIFELKFYTQDVGYSQTKSVYIKIDCNILELKIFTQDVHPLTALYVNTKTFVQLNNSDFCLMYFGTYASIRLTHFVYDFCLKCIAIYTNIRLVRSAKAESLPCYILQWLEIAYIFASMPAPDEASNIL